jgi:hypothetical protein
MQDDCYLIAADGWVQGALWATALLLDVGLFAAVAAWALYA